MAAIAKLDAKVAAVAGKQKSESEKSKKNQVCKFLWQGQCYAYKNALDCSFGHHLPDDKSRKHVAHPYPVKGSND
eukprot:6663059-Karenia_brevis.AAC.1